MKPNWSIVRFLFLLGLTGFLFGFAKQRNSLRKIKEVQVTFMDTNSPFITVPTVNKLLIQKTDSATSIAKETLVLKEMEQRLLQNPMIRDAQVFITIDGVLGAKIEQRNPIARVIGSPSFYIDEEGKKMPLSTVYSARVPIITGTSTTNFTELTPLLLKIKADKFMETIVSGIHKKKNNEVALLLRKQEFKIEFGTIEDIDLKFQNFKAFFQKAKKDTLLKAYITINLQFGSQVVATKK